MYLLISWWEIINISVALYVHTYGNTDLIGECKI